MYILTFIVFKYHKRSVRLNSMNLKQLIDPNKFGGVLNTIKLFTCECQWQRFVFYNIHTFEISIFAHKYRVGDGYDQITQSGKGISRGMRW